MKVKVYPFRPLCMNNESYCCHLSAKCVLHCLTLFIFFKVETGLFIIRRVPLRLWPLFQFHYLKFCMKYIFLYLWILSVYVADNKTSTLQSNAQTKSWIFHFQCLTRSRVKLSECVSECGDPVPWKYTHTHKGEGGGLKFFKS